MALRAHLTNQWPVASLPVSLSDQSEGGFPHVDVIFDCLQLKNVLTNYRKSLKIHPPNNNGVTALIDRKPWECHPDLTEERLRLVAKFFADTATEVASEHRPESGDDAWSLGCRRNAWWRNRMLDIVRSGDWPWLYVISPTKGFVFSVGAVPMRFYRGRSENPPNNTLSHRQDELRQLSLAFGNSNFAELKWRISIETDKKGIPVNIVLAGIKDGMVECYWSLPFHDVMQTSVAKFPVADEVDIAPPQVDIPADGATETGSA